MGEVEMVLNEIVFDIEPSKPARCHVWKEAVRNSFEDEALTDEFVSKSDYDRDSSNAVLLQQGIEDNATIVTYSFKAYYTNDFALTTVDPDLYFHSVIEATNEGYKNSDIPLRVKLACSEHIDMDDGNGDDLLNRFQASASSKNLHGGADAVGIFANNAGPGLCGLADMGGDGGVKSVMLMSKGCYYLTHGHEIGHNFGLGHESSWHGDNYRTLMNSNANAINFYSNPAVKRKGKPMGSDTINSAKRFTERRFMMAAHSDKDICTTKPNKVYRPVISTQMSVLPKAFKIMTGGSCAVSAGGPLAVTLLSEAGANCTFTASAVDEVSDLGECAFTDFSNGINRMEFQQDVESWCYDNFELKLQNGNGYKCSSMDYSPSQWNPAQGNACSTTIIA